MIFFGKGYRIRSSYGVGFERRLSPVAKGLWIWHYYLVLRLGFRGYWIGYNGLERIVRDKIYKYKGRTITYMKGGKNGKEENDQKGRGQGIKSKKNPGL